MNKKLLTTYYKSQTTLGFTLVELLISISIIILLVAVYIPYHRQFATKNELNMAMQELNEKVLQAQSLALAPREQDQNISYYRLVFYPRQSPIEYKILVGDYDLNNLPPTPEQIRDEKQIDQGFLAKNIELKAGVTNFFNGKQEGTIIFKATSGNCYYAWRSRDSLTPSDEQSYIFANQLGNQSSIVINLDSCKVRIE